MKKIIVVVALMMALTGCDQLKDKIDGFWGKSHSSVEADDDDDDEADDDEESAFVESKGDDEAYAETGEELNLSAPRVEFWGLDVRNLELDFPELFMAGSGHKHDSEWPAFRQAQLEIGGAKEYHGSGRFLTNEGTWPDSDTYTIDIVVQSDGTLHGRYYGEYAQLDVNGIVRQTGDVYMVFGHDNDNTRSELHLHGVELRNGGNAYYMEGTWGKKDKPTRITFTR